jgi:hypothetical protein
MIPLRIAFDMDGTLADLSSAYAEIEDRLFGAELVEHERPAPELREAEQHVEEDATAAATISDNRRVVMERRSVRRGTRHRDRVWRAIEGTPNFWTTLKPLENGAIKRLYQLTGEHNWEVFFVTQRPATAGATVQWQTHKWLVEQGFSTPSVIPLSDSSTRAILRVGADDPLAESSARRLGIGTARNIHEVLDLLVQATAARANPSLFEKLRKLVGWK